MTPTWAWPRDDPRWNDEAATPRFGPAVPPGRPDESSATRWRHRSLQKMRSLRSTLGSHRALVLAGSTLSLGLLGVAIVARAAGDPQPDDPGAPAAGCERAVGIVSDPPDGCVDTWSYDPSTAVLMADGEISYTIGEPGDVVAIGDWNCDDELTPGLYRPSTGEVFYFAAFAVDEGRSTSGPPTATGVIDGAATVREATLEPRASPVDEIECDRLVIVSR